MYRDVEKDGIKGPIFLQKFLFPKTGCDTPLYESSCVKSHGVSHYNEVIGGHKHAAESSFETST